jgi:hypothetical protein
MHDCEIAIDFNERGIAFNTNAYWLLKCEGERNKAILTFLQLGGRRHYPDDDTRVMSSRQSERFEMHVCATVSDSCAARSDWAGTLVSVNWCPWQSARHVMCPGRSVMDRRCFETLVAMLYCYQMNVEYYISLRSHRFHAFLTNLKYSVRTVWTIIELFDRIFYYYT